MPATINAMQPSRAAVAGSPNSQMPSERGADGADAGPDGVGGAERQVAQGEPEQTEADHHGRRG